MNTSWAPRLFVCLLLIVPALNVIAHAAATAQNVYDTIRRKMRTHTAPVGTSMNKTLDSKAQEKRWKVQVYFWNIVGAVKHINIPKLEDALRKEFHLSDDRLVQSQIDLMKTEGRIKVQNNVKVWIKQPPSQPCEE